MINITAILPDIGVQDRRQCEMNRQLTHGVDGFHSGTP